MTITPDNAAFIAEGRQILAQEVYGSYELEQLQMFTGLLLSKYEELVSAGGSAESLDALRHETAVIVEVLHDPEIGERARQIMRAVAAAMPDPTSADRAVTPSEPGLYIDKWGNTWRLHADGVFAMSSRIRASASRYAPFKRLEVVEDRPAAGVAPQEPTDWEHGVIDGEDLLARLMDTLAYYHCRSTNPKADSPYMGYHTFSEDQRDFLRERQRDAAEEVLRIWRAEASPNAFPRRAALVDVIEQSPHFQEYNGPALAETILEAFPALAAPVAVDEAKLAEVVYTAWNTEQGNTIPFLSFEARVELARVIAEWLRGGGQ